MNTSDLEQYLIPLAIVGFFGWRYFKFKSTRQQIPPLLKQGGVVIDVRSPSEFSQGSRPGSINIPLQDLGKRQSELNKETPIILCCASGARSGAALGMLKSLGFKNVINAGPWTNTLVN